MALLLTGLFAGLTLGGSASGRSASPVATEVAQRDDGDRLVTASLTQQVSPGERLRHVLVAAKMRTPDRRTLADLAGTLAFETSINVRYATVEALAPHAHDPLIRARIRSVLNREPAPLVQLAMIEFLAATGDQEAAPAFDRLRGDEQAAPDVREAARRALLLVNSSPADHPSPQTNHRQSL